MRVRKKPWAAQELLDNTLVINDAPEKKGKWKEYFGNDHPIYVEIGCGKGGFLRKNAEAYPDVNFIGIERQETVVAMAARRADEELPNLAFVWDNASNLSDLFEVGEFQRLYLNFSDPWPKKRTYKRRLTYRGFLQEYRRIMGENAEIFFKTDNRGLFEFSLNEFCADDWKLSNISLDLHNSDYEGNIMRRNFPLAGCRFIVWRQETENKEKRNPSWYENTYGEGFCVYLENLLFRK